MSEKNPIEVLILPSTTGPFQDSHHAVMGAYGCLRYNPTTPGDAGYYSGQVTIVFFDREGHYLISAGQPLVGNNGASIPFQNSTPGNDGHLFGSQWYLNYPVDPEMVSNRALVEIEINECRTDQLSSCKDGKISSYVRSALFFDPSVPVPLPERIGPCGSESPAKHGPAFTQVVMTVSDGRDDKGNVVTTISLHGCMRFNPLSEESSGGSGQVYPYFSGGIGAQYFDKDGKVLRPIGNKDDKPYGQATGIFPAGPMDQFLLGRPDNSSPIENSKDGFHAFGFQYSFDPILDEAIERRVNLYFTGKGCTQNDARTCQGQLLEWGPKTVRPCFKGRSTQYETSNCPSVSTSSRR